MDDESKNIFNTVSVEKIVDDVFKSGCLGGAERQKDLLYYLLDAFSKGRSGQIKAYGIAIDVLGRSEDFDASLDPIVRAEMFRLRKNLSQYNASRGLYEITFEKGSYEPKVCFSKLNQPSRIRRFKNVFVLIALSALILGAAFLFLKNFTLDSGDQKNELTALSPTIGVNVIESDYDDEATRKFVLDLISLHPNPGMVVLKQTPNPSDASTDLTLGIALKKTDEGARVSAIPMYQDGSSVQRKSFVFDEVDDLPYFAHKSVAFWLTNPENEVLRRFAISGDRDENQRQTFQCMLDVLRFYSEDELKFGDNSRLWHCITSYAPKDDDEKFLLGYYKGYLLERHINGEIDLGVKNAKSQFEANLKSMKSMQQNNSLVYAIEIPRVQKQRPLDKERLKGLALERYSKFDLMSKELSNLSILFGFTLGDWDTAMEILSAYFKEVGYRRKDIGHYVETGFHLSNRNFEKAKAAFALIPNINAFQVHVLGFAIGCNLGDTQLQEKAYSGLSKFGLKDWPSYQSRMNKTTFDKSLKDVFLEKEVLEPCFSERI